MPVNENVTGPYLCPLTSVAQSSFKPAETWKKHVFSGAISLQFPIALQLGMCTEGWEWPSCVSALVASGPGALGRAGWHTSCRRCCTGSRQSPQRGQKIPWPTQATSGVIAQQHLQLHPKGLGAKVELGLGTLTLFCCLLGPYLLFILCKFNICNCSSPRAAKVHLCGIRYLTWCSCQCVCGYLLFIFQTPIPGEWRHTRGCTLASHTYLDDPFDFSLLFLHG